MKVTGTNGVEVNGKLVKPPAEVILKAGDMFEMRKKRFVITFPHAPSQGVRPLTHPPRLPVLLTTVLRNTLTDCSGVPCSVGPGLSGETGDTET